MDGRFIPRGLGALEPVWLNIVDNITAIQFNHRIGAYVLSAAILAYAVMRARGDTLGPRPRHAPFGLGAGAGGGRHRHARQYCAHTALR